MRLGSRRTPDAYLGCLLGGAIGDALGAPIEFSSLQEIRRRFGPAAVTGFVEDAWPAGSITDDTQMTLFTSAAKIRFLLRPPPPTKNERNSLQSLCVCRVERSLQSPIGEDASCEVLPFK